MQKWLFILLVLFCVSVHSYAQPPKVDSGAYLVTAIPSKYFSSIDKKTDRYKKRLSSKTDKTLTKLVRWEKKIHGLLLKANPTLAAQLFANKELTFEGLQQNLQKGTLVLDKYQGQYNEYRDKLSTGLKYIQEQKSVVDSSILVKAARSSQKVNELETEVKESEAVAAFIKERKKQLITASVQYIGKSKYLSKMNKESYYYVETLKNYKEIFSDANKAEATAKEILSKIPAFQKFAQKNSMLASLFGTPADYGSPQSLAGLQTRASVNALIQDRLAAGGPNAREQMQQQMQAAQAELSKLKDKIVKGVPSNGEGDLPDFKPNTQRSKTFLQRLEYGTDLQFAKTSSWMPSTANVGLTVGYKLNDKSVIGVGLAYKLGMGSIEHIRLSHEGLGLRSYVDYKLKKNIFISGGYEMNYNSSFKKITALKEMEGWQQSGLVGVMKKLPFKTKLVKNTQIKLLYDFLYHTHVPVSQPWVFRVGYGL